MRKMHIPHRRWVSEPLLYTHRSRKSYRSRFDKVQEIDAFQYVHHRVLVKHGCTHYHHDEFKKYFRVWHADHLYQSNY